MGKEEKKGVKKPTEQADVVVTDNFNNVSREVLDQFKDSKPSAVVIEASEPSKEQKTTMAANEEKEPIVATSAAAIHSDGRPKSVDVNGKKKVERTETTAEQFKKDAVNAMGDEGKGAGNTSKGSSDGER